ncbi:MAG: dihydroorotase [Fidelibacterota bacterium]
MRSTPLPKLLLIKNERILDPLREKEFEGDILLKNGKILDVGKGVGAEGATSYDARGKIITHGFCDIHAHFREPGREDKETLASGANAALAGGFTTVCVMPNTDPPVDSPESVRFIVEKAQELPVTIFPIGAITAGRQGTTLTEMAAMVHEGAVAFSDDGIPVMDTGVLRRALEYARPLQVPVINHAEDLTLKGDGQMNEGEWSTKLGLVGIPDVSESTMVGRDVEVARYTAGKLHVPHLSSEKSVEWLRWAKDEDLRITGEVTPHHLYFSDAALQSFNTNLKVAPPLRTEEDRQSLIGALKDGVIDCIATDHAPHTVEDKESPFDWAPWGMIGLESAFGAVWKVLSEASFSLIEVIQKLTVNPRKIMGFHDDLLSVGVQAQLVILDPEMTWTFSRETIYSRSRNSPFIGQELRGKILQVISNGKMTSF